MYLNWGKIYVWGLLVLSFMESPISTNWYFLAFFVWSVNYSRLTCKLWILFWTFRDMWTLLKYYRIFGTVLYRKTGSHCLATFCWSINCITWMSLDYKKTYFRHVQKFKHYLYLRPFNAFSFTESSMLTIKHVFSFFWSLNSTSLVCKLYISIRFILAFWAVLILEVFYSCIFLKIKFNSWSSFRCFF